MWMLLIGAALLLVTVQSSLPFAEHSPHEHSVSLVWSHGHLHKVLSHHDDPTVSRSATPVASSNVRSELDHHHDGDHVLHAVSIETPVRVSTQIGGATISPSWGLCSICAPTRSNAPPDLGFPLRSPTLASLRTTVLLV